MTINMYSHKKKRAVDPNAPPRPNLMSHDKKLREQTQAFQMLHDLVKRQQHQIEVLQTNYQNMQSSVDQIVNFLRKGK